MSSRYLALLSLPFLASCEGVPTYNSVDSLPVDSNGRLAEHLLVFASPTLTTDCKHNAESTWGQIDQSERSLAYASDDLATYLGLDKDSCGVALCLERGTALDFVQHWNKRYPATTAANNNKKNFKMNEFIKWYTGECQAAEIGFVSCNNIFDFALLPFSIH
jgi:hypothetical protein